MQPANTFALHQVEAGIPSYGATKPLLHQDFPAKPARQAASPASVIGCVVVPLALFIATYYSLAFGIRYWMPLLAYAVVGILFVLCLVFGFMSFGAFQGQGRDALWLGLLCVLSLTGCIWASIAGNNVFENLTQGYYDLQQLNVYQSVNPSYAVGNQYMDFGVINFVENVNIEKAFAMSFKNDLTYCVAPVKLNANATQDLNMYDFWAVGINCCSQHLADFRCGEYNNPAARSGVRVTSEIDRSFYELAVRQSAAAFNIKAPHPLFFEWVSDPRVTIDGLQESGFTDMVHMALIFLSVQVVSVAVVLWFSWK